MKHGFLKKVLSVALAMLSLALMLVPMLPSSSEAASSNPFEAAVAAIEAKKPKTCTQISHYDATFTNKQDGLCNVCSMVTVLNRRLAYDNRSGSFTATDVISACGCTNIRSNKDGTRYSYNGGTGTWFQKTYTKGGVSYQAVKISVDTVKKCTAKAGFNHYIALLLHEHPEGIVIRSKTANHVAVITSYSVADNRVSLFVWDPVNNYKGAIEGSYIYKHSSGDLYSSLNYLVYLKGSKAISPIRANVIGLSAGRTASVVPMIGNSFVTYSSSNNSVCTVNSNGVVTAKSAGATTVTLKMHGRSYDVNVHVLPTTSITSAKAKLFGRMQLNWTRRTNISGYQIQYSTSSTFSSGVKSVTLGSASTTSTTIGSLSMFKTYYVRIRCYVKVGSFTFYSPWSGSVKVRTTL